MYTKIHEMLPTVLGVGPSQVEKEGLDAIKALICSSPVGQASIRQLRHWKSSWRLSTRGMLRNSPGLPNCLSLGLFH